jgi:hypothetical protein
MTAKILDFNQYRARKDARFAAELAMREVTLFYCQPYASMDDLPPITTRGQLELRALLGLT